MARSMDWACNHIALVACLCLYVTALSILAGADEITLERKQIFVNVTGGLNFSLTVEPDEIVLDLRRDLRELEGMSEWIKVVDGNTPVDLHANLGELVRDSNIVTIIMPELRKQHTTGFTVRTLDGRELPVTAQLGNTVASLKDNITQWTGISQAEQRLLLRGKELKNERKLVHYDIEDGTMLSLGRPLEECRRIVSIHVKTLSGATIKVAVNLADTVADLKEKIWEKTGAPVGVQRLFADARVIAGEDRLCDLWLEEGSTVYMILYSARVTHLDQVAYLQEPPVARPVDASRAPIFREVENVTEPAQRPASFYKDTRNWVPRDGPRSGWDPELFDPVVHLLPNPNHEESMQSYQATYEARSRPDASETERMEAVIIGARIRLSQAVRPYRVAANLTSIGGHSRPPGVTLGGGSTDGSSKQPVPLGADVNNWAPDAFSDSDVMRLFEVGERVRQALARSAQTGEGILGIASQRRINRAILFTYLEALAGFAPSVVYDQAGEGEVCGICMDGLTAEPAIKVTCGHAFHADCILSWVVTSYQEARAPSCPLCRLKFMFPYEAQGRAELETPELKGNQNY